MSEPSTAFGRLVAIMAALRTPEGCPWDREQTLQSLVHYVLEEAYEVVDAIERDDLDALREEVGDHIFEGVFLAQIASERGAFDVADAVQYAADKLVRRHPHVFQRDGRMHDADSRERAPSAEAALSRWDAQKASERVQDGKEASALTGVPRSLPAMLRAYKIGKRAAATGFDWERAADIVGKIREEIDELEEVVAAERMDAERAEEEMGDLLFAIANLSRKMGIEPEGALRKANDKFTERFQAMERRIAASERQMREMSIEDLEREWRAVKTAEIQRGRDTK
ncbi:MAG: nucleoside triphosphate pyrophosphohydrolase [Vicinamibacterales bacterium]